MRTLWRARIARDAGSVRAARHAPGGHDLAPSRPARLLLAEDLRPVARFAAGPAPPLGRPAGQVPRLGVRRRATTGAPPVPGGPPRCRASAQENEAPGFGGALRLRRR